MNEIPDEAVDKAYEVLEAEFLGRPTARSKDRLRLALRAAAPFYQHRNKTYKPHLLV